MPPGRDATCCSMMESDDGTDVDGASVDEVDLAPSVSPYRPKKVMVAADTSKIEAVCVDAESSSVGDPASILGLSSVGSTDGLKGKPGIGRCVPARFLCV